ncbi:MULE transposase [Hirsutella rhossiliensis]
MWKRFPEIMSFDNTYNTNRFKLPLFQVTGQTCLKSVYNAAFGLIDNEKREGFQFLAEGIKKLTDEGSIDNQFPDSQQQICIHHINSNVLLNAKRKWKNAKEESDSDGGSSGSGQTQIALTSGDIDAVLAVGRHGDPPLKNGRPAPVPHSYRGVLELWKYVVFAQTKQNYEKAWVRLCEEFNDQQAILTYLYKTYLPISAQ